MHHLAKILTVLITLAVAFALGELALRTFAPLPVHGGLYRDQDGTIVHVAQDRFQLRPSIDVTHTASEFTKRVQTNALGYRRTGNESDTPDTVFIGDSFTFGHGVADDETFASIYCRRTRSACQNLGRSGTTTFDQSELLAHALGRMPPPQTVVLVMLAACWVESSGNDLGDNYRQWHARQSTGAGTQEAEPPASLIRRVQRLLGGMETAKRIMLLASGTLKRGIYRCSEEREIEAAAAATGQALAGLEQLSRRYGFRMRLFVIHPYQELDGAHRTTEAHLRRVIPKDFDPVFTATEFEPGHYYAYDGHFNAAGHARLAEVIERSVRPQ
jgi:hypothetical protein